MAISATDIKWSNSQFSIATDIYGQRWEFNTPIDTPWQMLADLPPKSYT